MRQARGFTLVELVVALAVIGLAGATVALTLPSAGDVLARDADAFAARLSHARDEAILGMRAVEVAVTARGYAFSRRRLDGWEPLEGRGFDAVDWTPGTVPALPPRASRVSFHFDPTGATQPARLLLSREGRQARIALDDSGAVTVDGHGD